MEELLADPLRDTLLHIPFAPDNTRIELIHKDVQTLLKATHKNPINVSSSIQLIQNARQFVRVGKEDKPIGASYVARSTVASEDLKPFEEWLTGTELAGYFIHLHTSMLSPGNAGMAHQYTTNDKPTSNRHIRSLLRQIPAVYQLDNATLRFDKAAPNGAAHVEYALELRITKHEATPLIGQAYDGLTPEKKQGLKKFIEQVQEAHTQRKV